MVLLTIWLLRLLLLFRQRHLLIAPAMNTKMYDNPITQNNLKQLHEVGYQEIVPRSSRLACGDVGRGALADLTTILKTVQAIL